MPGAISVMTSRRRALPRRERVRDALERRLELGEVPQQQRPHRVVLDPVEALLRVDLGPEVVGEEAVRLEPPRRHQDEDPERGVAEAEPLRLPLRVHPDHRVDLLRIGVDPAQSVGVLRRVGHLLEGVVGLRGAAAGGTRCSAARRARARAGRRSTRGRCARRRRGGSPGGSAGSCAASARPDASSRTSRRRRSSTSPSAAAAPGARRGRAACTAAAACRRRARGSRSRRGSAGASGRRRRTPR